MRNPSVSRAIGALDTGITRLGPTRRAYVLKREALWSRPQGERSCVRNGDKGQQEAQEGSLDVDLASGEFQAKRWYLW